MLENKTQYFHSLRKSATLPLNCSLSIDPINESLDLLNSFVIKLNRKLEKNSLPSFDSKIKKQKELSEIRKEIQALSKKIEGEIASFNVQDQLIRDTVKGYLLNKLKGTLTSYKAIEQKNFVQTEESIKNSNNRNGLLLAEEQVFEEEQRNSNIKTNLLNLTNTLIQLKMALKTQSNMIDSIDHYFDQSNEFLKGTNKELKRIPGLFTKFKDWIIYFLLYVICILLMMILIKKYMSREIIPRKMK